MDRATVAESGVLLDCIDCVIDETEDQQVMVYATSLGLLIGGDGSLGKEAWSLWDGFC